MYNLLNIVVYYKGIDTQRLVFARPRKHFFFRMSRIESSNDLTGSDNLLVHRYKYLRGADTRYTHVNGQPRNRFVRSTLGRYSSRVYAAIVPSAM